MTTNGPHDPYEPLPAAPPVNPYDQQAAQGTAPPRMVTIAFWLWLAVSAVMLVNLIAVIGLGREAIEETLRKANTGLSGAEFEQAVDVGVGVAIAFPAVFLVVFLACAFPMRKGRNWARIVLTVFGGLLVVLSLLGMAGAAIISVLIVALIVAAIVLMYVRDSAAYFTPRR